MESDPAAPGASGALPPDEARGALDALDADRAALAERLRTPWWYYPGLGAILAAFVASPAIVDSGTRSTVVTFGCVGLVFLLLAHKRATGFAVLRDAGPRSRWRAICLAVAVVLLFVASLVAARAGAVLWVTVAAAAVFAATVAGGRWYDRASFAELRHGR